MNKGILLTIFASSVLLLNGCSNNAQTGAVIGSLVGAGIGKSTSNHRDKRAVVGAVLGGLVGAAVGEEQDRKIAASRTSTDVTSDHSHGDRSHTHQGATANHSHNGGAVASSNQQTVEREVVYVERPYYPATTSVILSSGYSYYPRRSYRHRKHYKYIPRHHSRHRTRYHKHHYKRGY